MAITKSTSWKYAWNPNGYGLETFEIDTSLYPYKVGDFLSLAHTYFKEEGFVIESIKEGVRSTLVRNKDYKLEAKDRGLSEIVGFDVYRKVGIVSEKMLNTVLSITCVYLGDALDPSYFGQVLNKDADVEHKSIKVKNATVEGQAFIKKLHIEEDLQFPKLGNIKDDTFIFGSNKIKLNSGVSIDNEKIKTDSEEFGIITSDNYFTYDKNKKRWYVYNPRHGEKVPLATFYQSDDSVRKFGIPVILENDPASLTTVSWLRIDPSKRLLVVENINCKELTVEKELTIKEGATVTIGKFKIKYDEEGLKIGDIIGLYPDKIVLGPLVMDQEFFEKIGNINRISEETKILSRNLKNLKISQ